jgi:RNA polymerase sporulation-specific sigma factor
LIEETLAMYDNDPLKIAIRYVRKAARLLIISGYAPDDLREIAAIGWMRGIYTHDPDRGHRLSVSIITGVKYEFHRTVKYVKAAKRQAMVLQSRDDWDIATSTSDNEMLEAMDEYEKEIRKTLKYVARLPEQERRVLCLRYGVNGESYHTFMEAAEVMGLHKASVQRLQRAALGRLREMMEVGS